MNESMNMFDLVVFGVVGLSALLSFFRGFLREVLSLGAWMGAGVITLYAFPHVATFMEPHIGSEGIANGFAAMGTFMLSLLGISVFNSLLLRYTKNRSEIGLLDNGLGLLFGIFRGALLVSLGFFSMHLVMQEDQKPKWLEHSIAAPYAQKGAAIIASVAPDYLKNLNPKAAPDTPALDEAIDKGKETADDSWQSMDELQKRMREEGTP